MLKNNPVETKKTYVTILADGKLHQQVPDGTEGAIKREYETSSGEKGTKTELVFTELSGIITDIEFYEGDYGNMLQVTVTDGEEEPVCLSVGTASNFGEDIMKKLPNIDLKVAVKLVPFSFEDDKKKKHRGITVYQDDKKVESFYYDKETKKVCNGYPAPKKIVKKSEWRKYFEEAREFLIEDVTKRLAIKAS